jgi:hypothetical protein
MNLKRHTNNIELLSLSSKAAVVMDNSKCIDIGFEEYDFDACLNFNDQFSFGRVINEVYSGGRITFHPERKKNN